MAIELDRGTVQTVADLRVGDRLPDSRETCGYIEIAAIVVRRNAISQPASVISWVHNMDNDPNAAPSIWSHSLEIHPGTYGYRLVRPRATFPHPNDRVAIEQSARMREHVMSTARRAIDNED